MNIGWSWVNTLPAAFTLAGPWLILKIAGALSLIGISNPGTFRRLREMLAAGEWIGLFQWAIEWFVALGAIAVVLLHPNPWVRCFWGVLIAVSSGAGFLYAHISGFHFSIHDFISGWTQRRSVRSVFAFYPVRSALALVIAVIFFALFACPPFEHPPTLKIALSYWSLNLLPTLSILLIIGEFQLQNGATLTPMPTQFTLLSGCILGSYKIFRFKPRPRQEVVWRPVPGFDKQNIVLLVDESIRGDYVSLMPGNKLTPQLPKLAEQFVNFGPAVSGGNMSTYSNAILRFGVRLDELKETANLNPTLFRYAKEAGFRTVYIDAQSELLKSGRILVNFMSLAERVDIDAYYNTREGVDSDFELADIIATELAGKQPVFIYATKNGAHFPYEWSYPPEGELPPVRKRKTWGRLNARHIAAYRKALLWSVDKFMTYFFQRVDLSRTTLIYTSDHGQLFRDGEFPHGQVLNPDPRTGIVPLLVHSSDPKKRQAFEQGAQRCRGRASHFLIAPTVYELMGYAREDIAKKYPCSLFTGTIAMPVMTSGDIFGLFKSPSRLTEVDPSKDYFENEAQPEVSGVGKPPQPQGSDQVLTLV